MNKTQPSSKAKPRLLSIDALRGFDMIWILGAEGIFAALFLITGWSLFDAAAAQMLHSSWHGFTAYDLIFPLFIFLSGVSLGLSAKSLSSLPPTQAKSVVRHGLKRLGLLILLGIVYNHGWGGGIPTSLEDIRYVSVLGRIGIAWFFTALIIWYLSDKALWYLAGGLLLGYWLLLECVTLGGYGGGNYSAQGALNAWFDVHLLPGITYKNLAIDPEGLLSNLGSIVNGIAGAIVGRYLKLQQSNPRKLITTFFAWAIVLIVLGYLWGMYLPINKTLWSSSFVLVTLGYSLLLLLAFYLLFDVIKMHTLGVFFAVIGTNSIIIYLGTSLINWRYTTESVFGGVIASAGENWQPLILVLGMVALQWLGLYWLYCRKIYIKV